MTEERQEEDKGRRKWIWHIAASVIASLIIGTSSSYLTAQITTAVNAERIANMDKRIQQLESKEEDRRQELQAVRDRLARMEAKIDLIMARTSK